MKILIIQPPHYFGSNSRPPSAFPLGVAYIAAQLKKSGHTVSALDIYAHQFSEDETKAKVKRLGDGCDIFCISAMSTQYKYVKWLINAIKMSFDKPVILGNSLPTYNSECVLTHTRADACVIGEGEKTILELLNNMGDLKKVKGIAYRNNGSIQFTGQQEYIANLDTIDFPYREIFPVDIYLKYSCLWSNAEIKAVDIVTARGCPYNCNFCSKTFDGIRLRSVENIIQEIEELRARYNFKGINFHDELTLINKQRTYALCGYLKKAKLSWVCQGRVNLVDQDLLRTMKDSGCKALGFGVESGSQKILDNMHKGITVGMAIKAINATKKAGIEPIIQMMYGYKGEDNQTLGETVEFFRRIKCPTMQFSMTTALPGTKLYKEALNNNLIRNEDEYLDRLDWGYYGDREVLINFTAFSDADLIKNRKEVESEINRNYKEYLLIHPWVPAKILFKQLRAYYLCNGFIKTFKKVFLFFNYFKKDSWMI